MPHVACLQKNYCCMHWHEQSTSIKFFNSSNTAFCNALHNALNCCFNVILKQIKENLAEQNARKEKFLAVLTLSKRVLLDESLKSPETGNHIAFA